MALPEHPAVVSSDDSGRPGRDTGAAGARRSRLFTRFALLVGFGPGLAVMLADTDAGSVVTAAQSGARWGYRLLALEVVLIPVLYVVQELTVRLGIWTRQGHGALIREHFGPRWALLSGGTLFVASLGALVTELAGLAGAGELAGIPDWATLLATTATFGALCAGAAYRRVELAAIAVGLLELVFVPAAVLSHPEAGALWHAASSPLVASRPYFKLVAANVGAVIMPWMVFYQQQAVVDKGILPERIGTARADTAIGAVATQVVMVAILVATAATIGRTAGGRPLDTIGEIAGALQPFLGRATARLLFGLGMLGAAAVATVVVTVGGAWGLSEVLGWRHSLNESPRLAWKFRTLCVSALGVAALAVLLAPNLVELSVDVQVINAALLPVVLGFLLAVERRALPPAARLHGARNWATSVLVVAIAALGLTGVVLTLA